MESHAFRAHHKGIHARKRRHAHTRDLTPLPHHPPTAPPCMCVTVGTRPQAHAQTPIISRCAHAPHHHLHVGGLQALYRILSLPLLWEAILPHWHAIYLCTHASLKIFLTLLRMHSNISQCAQVEVRLRQYLTLLHAREMKKLYFVGQPSNAWMHSYAHTFDSRSELAVSHAMCLLGLQAPLCMEAVQQPAQKDVHTEPWSKHLSTSARQMKISSICTGSKSWQDVQEQDHAGAHSNRCAHV